MGITKPIDDLGAGTGPPGDPSGGRMPGIGGGCNRNNIIFKKSFTY